ncbi:hypothetical protein D3C81_1527450 [compost metagenome]
MQLVINLKTSAFLVLICSSFIFLAVSVIYCTHLKCKSTESTCSTPRDASSKLIFPVPAKRSRQFKPSNSKRFCRILNKASLAISVVGLTGKLVGGFSLKPPILPPIIRIILNQIICCMVLSYYSPPDPPRQPLFLNPILRYLLHRTLYAYKRIRWELHQKGELYQ